MNPRSKRGLRALTAFIVLMAALTFLSKTIYNATLPHVEAVRVTDGTLQLTVSGSALVLDGDSAQTLRLEHNLSATPLPIQAVFVQAMVPFENSAALIAFDSGAGEYAYTQALQSLQDCQDALSAWDIQWQQSWDQLLLERLVLEEDALNSEISPDIVARRKDNLEAQFRLLEQDKILDGVYRSTLQTRWAQAKALVDCLAGLRQNDWRLLSPQAGIACEIMVQPGDRYTGLTPLLYWISPSDPTLRVGIVWDKPIDGVMLDDVQVTSVHLAARSASPIAWTFAGSGPHNGQQMLWAQPSQCLESLSDIQSLRFEMRSPYQPLLVPNEAVIGGSTVYVLDYRTSPWGGQECIIRAVNVQPTLSDYRYTALSGGISASSQVVVHWDRPLQDGDVVFVQ